MSTLKPVDKIGLQVETKPVMPHASQRYSENTAFSNRAVTRDGAFVKFSRTFNGQARTKNCTFASLTPCFYFVSGYKDYLGVNATDNTYRAITLLHELAHALNIVYGASAASQIKEDDASRDPSGSLSKTNSQIIYDNCFKQ